MSLEKQQQRTHNKKKPTHLTELKLCGLYNYI